MALETSTVRCPGCAANVAAGAAWCGQCFAPMPAAAAAPAASPMPVEPPEGFRPGGVEPVRPKIYTDSRWHSGSMTFGPVGRVLVTIVLFLPYGFFVASLPFGLVGIIIWTGLLVRGLRDIWKPSRRHYLPPEA
jgi:hypothetical protein